jgi:(1->4)-alpha-D-glucan 1-alpha-D-glucosylmutase
VHELASILTAVAHLPARTETDPARLEERAREKEIVKRRLAALLKESAEARETVGEPVRAVNGRPGDPASFDALDALLAEQVWRLADWRVAGDEVNYRRFFDVNHLAAIRMEHPAVFEAAHRLLETWRDGRVKLDVIREALGLRRERPDLFPPGAYQALQARGERSGHLGALARRPGDQALVAAVPPLTARLAGLGGAPPLRPDVWGDTWVALGEGLPGGAWRDRFTGAPLTTTEREGAAAVPARGIFAEFPLALRTPESP